MPSKRTPAPVVEEAPVEPKQSAFETEPKAQVVLPEDLAEGVDPVDLPDQTLEDDYQAFKQFVLQTLSDQDERIRDVETVQVNGVTFTELQVSPGFGEGRVFRADQDVTYPEPNEDEDADGDVPEYVAEYRAAGTDGDGTPWLTS